MRARSNRGFTLLEALVAMGLVTSGVLTLAALAMQVTGQVAWSRQRLTGLWLADAAVAAVGTPPIADTGADCLSRDIAGCFELVDARGQPTASVPAWVRRWRVVTLVAPPGGVWSVSVCLVAPAERSATAAPGACISRVVHGVAP